jgi:hypothetical protein
MISNTELSGLLNAAGNFGSLSDAEKHEVTTAMTDGGMHRTNVQGFTRFIVSYLVKLSQSSHDLRNEASVKLAKKFVERIAEDERFLPYI